MQHTHACRSPALQHLDFALFSLLLSSAAANRFVDVGGLFVLLYAGFWLVHLDNADACA